MSTREPKDPKRKPTTFDPNDPQLKDTMPEPDELHQPSDPHPPEGPAPGTTIPTLTDLQRGFRWGALFFAAATALAGLSLSLWFARLVSVALESEGWLGWVSIGLLAAMGLAATAIALREILGLFRLNRLAGLRKQADAAHATDDLKQARAVVRRLKAGLRSRPDMKWALSRFREDEANTLDGAGLLALADRQLMAPIDKDVRAIITKSGRRVALTTALSPSAAIDVLTVLAVNLGMVRKIATLYGGRPGLFGGLKLARMVITHIAVTGGLALTEDLFGQFVGQDLLRRLSRKAGEGMFNGALTARFGLAAMDVCRPIPFLETRRPRFRDFAKDIAGSFVNSRTGDAAPPGKG